MQTFWQAIESIPGVNAVAAVWVGLMGRKVFERVRTAYFRKRPEPAPAVFCENCFCAHRVVRVPPGEPAVGGAAGAEQLVGVCLCDAGCPDIPLSAADLEIWELNWARLGRSLCVALELEVQLDRLSCPGTRQVGTWSPAGVPVFLTIQSEPEGLRWSISELVARLQSPFILLVPTAAQVTATCCELLAHARAGYLALDTAVQLAEDGGFRPVQPPHQLLAAFRPQPDETFERATARRAMALIENLEESEEPTPLQAFRLYCIDGMSEGDIAETFGVNRSTVSRRLRQVKLATGQTLAALRGMREMF